MSTAFIDTSVLIGVVFRNQSERDRCRELIPNGAECVTSSYVIFETARGFLRNLIHLHNLSFDCESFGELHEAAHSGQRRFQHHRRGTWLGAFDDYFKALEIEDRAVEPSKQLCEFRAKLRTWIRRGWKKLNAEAKLINPTGCRDDLPPPVKRRDGRIDHILPLEQCGSPENCGLQKFVAKNRAEMSRMQGELEQQSDKSPEAKRWNDCLSHLIAMTTGEPFKGKKCHYCGDPLICMEAPADSILVSKNERHFRLICGIIGKEFSDVS